VLRLDVAVTAARAAPDGVAITVESTSTDRTDRTVTWSRAHVLVPELDLADRPRDDRPFEDAEVDLRSEWSNADAVIRRGRRRVGMPAAHIFSECSGIWNPVFTDKAVALRHGRAFLALPPAGVLAMVVGGALQLGAADPGWVRRVQAEFGAPVPVPAMLDIEAEVPNRLSGSSPLRFRAHLEDGTPVVTSGLVVAEPVDVDIDRLSARARAERRRQVRPGRRAVAP
jgi:hypothetical protein